MFRKINNCLVAILILGVQAQAQFRYTCDLQQVSQTGFYKIAISPELSAFTKTDLSDIRIADEKKQWIPYILKYPDLPIGPTFLYLPEIKIKNSNSETILIIQSNAKQEISNWSLEVKNAHVNRFASISGSDDGKQWYSITDSLLLKNPEGDRNSLKIYFPPVAYSSFRVKIFNGKNDPLSIQKVTSLLTSPLPSPGKPVINPAGSFVQTDTSGYSFIRVEQPDDFQFDFLDISVSAPKYYEREVSFYLNAGGNIAQLLKTEPIQKFTVSTNSSGVYSLPFFKSKIFYLLIKNNDNPPLRISAVKTSQSKRELIAWLESGKNYRLFLDDSFARPPDYDLKNFSQSIPDSVTTLSAGKFEATTIIVANRKTVKNSRWWIWPTIILVIILLSISTLALNRDLKKTK
jgi:hypothetical protein